MGHFLQAVAPPSEVATVISPAPQAVQLLLLGSLEKEPAGLQAEGRGEQGAAG